MGLDPTKLGKKAEKAATKASKQSGKEIAGRAQAALSGDSELASDWLSSPWLGLGAALLAVLVLSGVWLLWRKRRREAAEAPPRVEVAHPDALKDYRQFAHRLPGRMRRVLDEFQPVIILGNVASEKERIISSLSGFEKNQQLFPGRVSHLGEAVELYLAARCLLVVPSEQFLAAGSSSDEPRWRKLLERICRVRAPRVVICLSQASVDSGDQDAMTQWTALLRAHVDTLAELRDEPVSVSVILAQSPRSSQAPARLTDAFFELVAALGQSGRYEELLHVPLAGISRRIGPGEEQRKHDGQVWVAERLRECQRGFPRLLSEPGRNARRILELAALFEHFDVLTGALGIALAELFVDTRRGRFALAPHTLNFLPFQQGRFESTLDIFDGPSRDEGARWHPSGLLLHRAAIASSAVLATLAVGYWHATDRQEWLSAARVVRDYDPGEPGQDIRRVEDYFTRQGLAVLPGFYDRDRLRCRIVRLVRERLDHKIDSALSSGEPPERVLQLVSLYVTGAPNDCGIDRSKYSRYERLSQTIEKYIDQWRRATELQDEEIRAYLLLSCPKEQFQLNALDEFQEKLAKQPVHQGGLPNVSLFGRKLTSLSRECPPTLADRAALAEAERVARQLLDEHRDQSGTIDVLEAMQRVPDPVMRRLVDVFARYRGRLNELRDLGNERDDLSRLARDVVAFAEEQPVPLDPGRGALPSFVDRARATLSPVALREPRVRLNLSDEFFVVDRYQLRAALQRIAFGRLSVQLLDGGRGAESLLFGDERHAAHSWGSRAPRAIQVLTEADWRHTLEGFGGVVQPALADYAAIRQSAICPAEQSGEPPGTRHLEPLDTFVQRSLEDYLDAYNRQWRAIYASLDMSALLTASEAQIARALDELVRPTSPLLSLVRETARQVALPQTDGTPFLDSLWMARQGLEKLEAVTEDKALAEYRSLLQALAEAAHTSPDAARDPSGRDPGDPQAFRDGLSELGRLVLAGLDDESRDLERQLEGWGEGLGLSAELLAPLREPFRVAYARGRENVRAVFAGWWKAQESELRAEVLSRFPFRRSSEVEASVEQVTSWLQPERGRFDRSLRAARAGLARCTGCLSPDQGEPLLQRVTKIQSALFDDSGQPQQLRLNFKPIPFAQSTSDQASPLLKAAVLRAAGSPHRYFNTEPTTTRLELPWHEAYDAQLEVELAGDDATTPPRPVHGRPSAWSFLDLLRQADPEGGEQVGWSGGRYTWKLGDARVSYDVCADASHCNELLSGVFAWR